MIEKTALKIFYLELTDCAAFVQHRRLVARLCGAGVDALHGFIALAAAEIEEKREILAVGWLGCCGTSLRVY